MGASAWGYFVPYKEDIQEALQQLRNDIFVSGHYYRPGNNLCETYEEFIEKFGIKVEANQFEKQKAD